MGALSTTCGASNWCSCSKCDESKGLFLQSLIFRCGLSPLVHHVPHLHFSSFVQAFQERWVFKDSFLQVLSKRGGFYVLKQSSYYQIINCYAKQFNSVILLQEWLLPSLIRFAQTIACLHNWICCCTKAACKFFSKMPQYSEFKLVSCNTKVFIDQIKKQQNSKVVLNNKIFTGYILPQEILYESELP